MEPQRQVGRPGVLGGLALSCHPVPTSGVTALAAVLSAAIGLSPGRTALVAITVLAGQLSIGWSNDAIDAERDARTARADKPVATGAVPRSAVAVAAGGALAATIALSLAVGVLAGAVHLLFVACGWAYNLGLKSTAVSFVPYAIGFAALPSFVLLARPGAPAPPWWLAGAGGLLGIGAHLVNVLPDLDDDRATGVRGWPHRLGRRRSTATVAAALGTASLLLVLAPPGSPNTGALGGVALALAAAAAVAWLGFRRPDSGRMLLLGVIAVALIDIGLLVTGASRLR